MACEQRIGVIIVGPSGSGKSTLWEILERAYARIGRKTIVYKMNPKAMPRQQLLGSMNMDTREWSDGVLTAAARRQVVTGDVCLNIPYYSVYHIIYHKRIVCSILLLGTSYVYWLLQSSASCGQQQSEEVLVSVTNHPATDLVLNKEC